MRLRGGSYISAFGAHGACDPIFMVWPTTVGIGRLCSFLMVFHFCSSLLIFDACKEENVEFLCSLFFVVSGDLIAVAPLEVMGWILWK